MIVTALSSWAWNGFHKSPKWFRFYKILIINFIKFHKNIKVYSYSEPNKLLSKEILEYMSHRCSTYSRTVLIRFLALSAALAWGRRFSHLTKLDCVVIFSNYVVILSNVFNDQGHRVGIPSVFKNSIKNVREGVRWGLQASLVSL